MWQAIAQQLSDTLMFEYQIVDEFMEAFGKKTLRAGG